MVASPHPDVIESFATNAARRQAPVISLNTTVAESRTQSDADLLLRLTLSGLTDSYSDVEILVSAADRGFALLAAQGRVLERLFRVEEDVESHVLEPDPF